MSNHDNRKNDVKELGDKIKGIHIAMMTTIEPDGTLHSRPMVTQDTEFDGDLWFFTHATTPRVGDVETHQQVNLSYAGSGDKLFVSVSGTAQLVHDQKKMKDLWKPILKTWFPAGEDDPDLVLLKVHVDSAEYWDAGKTGLLYTVTKGLTAGGKDSGGTDVKLDMK